MILINLLVLLYIHITIIKCKLYRKNLINGLSKGFKNDLKGKNLNFLMTGEFPEYIDKNDGVLDYSYMTKNRGNRKESESSENEKTNEVGTNTEPENLVKTGSNNDNQNSNNSNSNNNNNNTTNNSTTNNYAEKTSLKDDVPLTSSMKTPVTAHNNINSRTDSSHHKGDTSTFVTNNFFNPNNNNGSSTEGMQLEYEYLWKRIYDIDNKLKDLVKIDKKTASKDNRKGLIITLDTENNNPKNDLLVDTIS